MTTTATPSFSIFTAGVQRDGKLTETDEYVEIPVSITTSGTRHAEPGEVWRSEEELRRMAELMEGMPVFIGPDHPPLGDVGKMAGLNVADPDFPTTGQVRNVRVSEVSDGRLLAQAVARMYKKDRAGNDRTGDITAMKTGDLKNVSPGMYTHFLPEEGTDPQGKPYKYREWGTKPTHLMILTEAPPDCKPPLCTVHATASSSCSCPDEQEGDQDMTDTKAPPKGDDEAPADVGVAVPVPSAVQVIVNGQAPVAPPVAPAVQSEDETSPDPAPEAPAPQGDGTTTLSDEERTELEALRKEKEEAKKAEREAQVKAITEALGEEGMKHYFPDGVPEDMCHKDVERWVQVAADLKVEPTPAAAPEAPAPDAPEPAAQSEPEKRVFKGLKIRGSAQAAEPKARNLSEVKKYKAPVGP